MRDFATRLDINPPDATYPDGQILDSNPPSAKNGTALEESLIGDLWQWMLKMMREAGIAENGLEDNETNGYQMYDALVNRIEALGTPDDSISTVKVQDRAITFPKMEEIAENRIMGRNDGAGNGDMQELTIAQILSMLDITSGTWSPTTSTSEFNNLTLGKLRYLRIQNEVIVSGHFSGDPAPIIGPPSVQMTLPIASNFSNDENASGIVVNARNNGQLIAGGLESNAGNDRIIMYFNESSGGPDEDYKFFGMYEIL